MAVARPIGPAGQLRDMPVPRFQIAIGVASLLVLIVLVGINRPVVAATTPDGAARVPDTWGLREAVARKIAQAGPGVVSFAVIDRSGARVAAYNAGNHVSAASTLKAMVLAAYLRQERVAARDLSSSERARMTRMITWSSNNDASKLLKAAGWKAMDGLALEAGMQAGYTPDHDHWGLTQISAASMAKLFHELPSLIPERHREFALRLFGEIVVGQQWGMAEATPTGWAWHVKGGWIDEAVSQLGTFTRGNQEFTVAITVEAGPGTGSAVSSAPESVPAVVTIERITRALFGDGTMPGQSQDGLQACAGAAGGNWTCTASPGTTTAAD